MKKNGFTLIELLAVILILGVVALIAIPVVNGIVKESRKGSFEQTNKSVVDALSTKCNTELIKGNAVAGTYYIVNGEIEGINIGINGNLPDNGYVVVDSQCNIAIASYNSRYCATKELEDDSVAVIDYNKASDECSVDSEIATPANETVEDTCFTFNDNGNDTVTITGYDYNNASCSKDLVVPTTIDGKKVTTIADFAFVSTDKIIVSFKDKVSDYYTEEYIENYTGTKSDIFVYASHKNSDITGRTCYKSSDGSAVSVPINYIHTTGDSYRSCYFNTTAAGWSDRAYNAYTFNSIDLSKAIYLTEVPDGMILGANLTSMKLNSNINRIGRNAFEESNLTGTLTIPSSVKEIGATAFLQNELTALNLPNGLVTIGYDAFYHNNLSTIVIPSTVTDIGRFSFCQNLITSVTLPEGLKMIAGGAFSENNLTSIVIPSTVETIEYSAFVENSIQSVIIPNSVVTIGDSAFDTNSITTLSLGTGLKNLGYGAFAVNSITSLVIPNNVLTIGESAFYGNPIKNLTLGTGITTIPIGAFYQNSIENIVIPNTVTTIQDYAFAYNYSKTVDLGNGVKTIGAYAFLANAFTNLVIPNNVTTINHNGFRANTKYLTSLTIGTGLTTIGSNAFANNKLTTLNIPDNVKSLGGTVFANGNLTSVTIGSGITTIGANTFGTNTTLTSITINRLSGTVTGSPWGATNATVTWTGTV